jgi:signal recognition particle GTPase
LIPKGLTDTFSDSEWGSPPGGWLVFQDLTARLDGIFKSLRGRGVLSEDNVRESLREVRRALLEADVHFKVAKEFVKRVEGTDKTHSERELKRACNRSPATIELLLIVM